MLEATQTLTQQPTSSQHAHTASVNSLLAGTRTQLQGLGKARQTMAQELRAYLNQAKAARHQAEAARQQNEAARRQNEAQRARERSQVLAHRTSDVGAQLQGYRDELTGARATWRQLGAATQAKTGGVAVAPAHPMEGAAVEPREVTRDFAALRHSVFAFLADHPDGVRFVEIERQFRLNSQEASSVVKRLVEEGKARRAGRLYSAA